MPKTAPGKSHRNAISLVEIMRMFPDDATAEAWFVEQRWPDGPYCPACGSANVQTGAKHAMPFRCRERQCRKRFSVKLGTVMQGSNLGYRTWAVAIYLHLTSLKGVSSMKLHNDLNISQKSAWHLAHRLREAFGRDGAMFSGPVEADETYMGGERRNMSKTKRAAMNKSRGPVGKTAVVGAKDRASNAVRARVVQRTDAPHVAGFVAEHARIGARVYTDEAAVYRVLKPCYAQQSVNHSAGEYVNFKTGAGTQGIESFWSMLKRGHRGIYHKMSPKHLHRYVAEFAGRHNIREADTAEQMAGIVAGMAGKRLRYSDLTADNGLSSGARG